MSLSPHTIRRRHAAASSCTSCVPHGRTTGPTSPGTALLCYSDVFCVCFVRPSAQGRLLLRVLRAFRLLRCVKLFYQLARLKPMSCGLLEHRRPISASLSDSRVVKHIGLQTRMVQSHMPCATVIPICYRCRARSPCGSAARVFQPREEQAGRRCMQRPYTSHRSRTR